MIDFISGIIADKSPTRVVLENSGIGFLLFISTNTYKELPAVGERIVLKTYLHVREDHLQLYAFADEKERLVFGGLISVSGIGPRLAQTILSGIALEDLIGSIQNGDVARLTKISGVGVKTAQRLIIDLKEKFTQLGLIKESGTDKTILPVLTALEEEAAMALISLGYKRPAVDKALAKARSSSNARTVETLIKEALQVI
jgi:Holliday junction DNA helicase RuvA